MICRILYYVYFYGSINTSDSSMVQLTFSSYQTGQHSTVKVTLVSAESSGELAPSLHLEMVFAEAGPNPGSLVYVALSW